MLRLRRLCDLAIQSFVPAFLALTVLAAGPTAAQAQSHVIAATAGAHGTITPSGDVSVDDGLDQSFTIAADAGYAIADVLVDGSSVGAVASYTFTGVTSDHTIAASFAPIPHTILASAESGGTITPSGTIVVNEGSDTTFTITADPGQQIADVVVDGASVGAVASYTFTGVTTDHTIHAAFAPLHHTIAASAGPYGTIAPSGAVDVLDGASQAFTITPGSGYLVANVLVDGASVGTPTDYTFTNVTADHTIAVTFRSAAAASTISLTTPAGTITPANPSVTMPVTVARGDATPALGFSVRVQLGAGLALQGGLAGIEEGAYLASDGAITSFHVQDLGGGLYQVDDVTLGSPCGASGASGTLFTLALAAGTPAGSDSVTITRTWLRNCDNASMSVSAGAPIVVAVDVDPPAVAVTSPNGGEFWAIGSTHAITWSASDASGVSSVDLLLSRDGGLSFPDTIAAGVSNSGSFAWLVPNTPSTMARVRAIAHDGAGNVASDASDANFSIGPWVITASAGSDGTISPSGSIGVTDGGSQAFTITPNAGAHRVDVFVDGNSVGPVSAYTFSNVTADHSIHATFAVNPAVPPVSGLTATTLRSGNDGDGTVRIRLNWSTLPAGETIRIYRAPFGNYPEYDDGPSPGSAPVASSFPPGAPWVLTSVTTSGTSDDPGARDCWYYVAYATDAFGTTSPPSAVTTGALSYFLGDVSTGLIANQGDNQVTIADVSLLGAHYGLLGTAVAPFAYLDVGPTQDGTVNTRPTTDDEIGFDDLVMFAINFGMVSAPPAARGPAARPAAVAGPTRLELSSEDAGADVTARVWIAGAGDAQALSVALDWDPAVVAPASAAPGDVADSQGGVLMSARPGTFDVAMLGLQGEGFTGEGLLGSLSFHRVGPGDPHLSIRAVDARDPSNQKLTIQTSTRSAPLPAVTSFTGIAPNPSRATATASFALARAGVVELALFGIDGRRVRTIARGLRAAGTYALAWDGRDDAGARVAPGLYYARLVTPEGTFTRRVVRIP